MTDNVEEFLRPLVGPPVPKIVVRRLAHQEYDEDDDQYEDED